VTKNQMAKTAKLCDHNVHMVEPPPLAIFGIAFLPHDKDMN
jgi:hypothetical protein